MLGKLLNPIKEKINLNKTIEKILSKRDSQKYFLVKKDNFFIPRNIVKREGYIPINIFYETYPVDSKYVLVKIQIEYIPKEEYITYNNTLLLNTPFEYGIPDDYFWVYNIYQYFINKKIDLDFQKEVYIDIPKGEDENKDPKKLMRYNFIQEIILKYNENLSQIYKDGNYLDFTEEFFYIRNKEKIKNIISFLKKIGLHKDNKYSKIMVYDKIEDTDNYIKLNKILGVYDKNLKIYPLLNEYLDSNLDYSIFVKNNKEYFHKIFKINDINNIISSKVPYDYIISKGNLIVNLSFYIYFLEKIFFKSFLKKRDISKLKLSINEKINLDKIERLPLLMAQLLSDNSILIEMIKLYHIIKNDALLGIQEYFLAYNLKDKDITEKVDNDIKTILKDGEHNKIRKEDYILEELETEFFKYNLDYIPKENYINKIIKKV